jgi:hypothetical protein
MQKLDQAGHGTPDGSRIACVQVIPQAEVAVEGLCVIAPAQLTECLGEVINNKPVVVILS